MADGLKDARKATHPMLCGLCGHIRAGIAWVENRRATYDRYYSESICPDCRANAFPGNAIQGGAGKG